MTTDKTWVVTVADDAPLAATIAAIEGAGLTVASRLDEIRIVTGTADEQAAARLRALAGVADVTADAPIDVGPPGSDQSW